MNKRIIASLLTLALCGTAFLPLSITAEAEVTDFVTINGDVTEIYVSVDGDDSGAGDVDSPFKTLERAREKVRELNDDMTGDIIVNVGEGVYTLDETFALTSEDSGSNGYKVIYKGIGREKTLISGGTAVDGWELYDAENNIYRASVSEDADFRQLYVNGEKAIRARSGKVGTYSTRILDAERIKNGVVLPELMVTDNASSRAQADDGTIYLNKNDKTFDDSWSNLDEVELHVFTAWSVNILRIKSVTDNGMKYSIKIADEEAALVFNRQHPNIDGYIKRNFIYYVENAYELIDADNEWYLDRDENVLYYKAPADLDPNEADIIAPKLETLVHIKDTLDAPVCNIAFTNIGFAYSNWIKPSEEGFVDGQAMQYVTRTTFGTNDVGVGRPAAGILVEAADSIVFDDVKISNMGATGIDFHYGVTNSTVANSLVTDISGNGISVGKFVKNSEVDYHEPYNPTDKREICDGDMIVNNEIYRVGRDYECAVGIAAGYPKNILIANNTIAYGPYSGISVGFGWTKTKNAMSGNRILRNEIYNVAEVLCDAGGIYTLSEQPDSEMWGNYIHDIKVPVWADYGTSGIYLDEGTGGYYITHNVIEKAYGITPHVAGYNSIVGNFVNENGKVKGDDAEAVKAKAGVQESFDLSELENIPQVNDDFSELVYTEVFRDDFESYDEGRFSSDKWKVEKSQSALVRVVSDDGNKVIKMTSIGKNTKLNAIVKLGANVTQFDFCFTEVLSGYEGMYNVLRQSDVTYTADLTPAFSTTVRLENKSSGDVGISKAMKTGKWYTCKTMVYESTMYIKIWAAEDAEPEKWDVMREMDDTVKRDAVAGLEFYAGSTKSMYIDNIVIHEISEKKEPDDTVVTDTAEVTDDADTTDSTDTATSDTEPTEQSGCGSSLAFASVIVTFTAVLGCAVTKKR